MAGFCAGDRVAILETTPPIQQKTGTVLDVWLDSPSDAYRIYRVKLDDGAEKRVPGRDLELLLTKKMN
jgi:hypothetical protein